MPDRKQTPDIMSELMAGKKETPARKPVSHKDGIPVSQYNGIMVSMKKAKQKRKEPAPAAEAKPIKATFYLSPKSIEALEQLWMKRRQEAEPQLRGRISKSLLVEEAIGLLSRR
jgi:hypothetical protein